MSEHKPVWWAGRLACSTCNIAWPCEFATPHDAAPADVEWSECDDCAAHWPTGATVCPECGSNVRIVGTTPTPSRAAGTEAVQAGESDFNDYASDDFQTYRLHSAVIDGQETPVVTGALYERLLNAYTALASPPSVAVAQEAVAWTRTDAICDEEGRAIGTDEPRIVWGSEHPDPDGETWWPLYGGPR
jgi:hypothetical protein